MMLKPENVFLNSNDCAKIGDFGLATDALRPQPHNGAEAILSKSLRNQCGTHFYMVPELAHNGTHTAKRQNLIIILYVLRKMLLLR